MDESKKLPSCGTGTKNPDKGTIHGQKNERDTAEADEDESQERVEEDTTLFRACDDREIEMNGLREFSKNLKFDKPTTYGRRHHARPCDRRDKRVCY